jgi:hypothetical protein
LEAGEEMSKLYMIWQEVNNGWDTYNSAIVCADNEEEARNVEVGTTRDGEFADWANVKDVQVKYIGIADVTIKKGTVHISFKAG